MKKLFLFLVLAVLFTSCNNDVKLKPEEQLEQTTLKLQQQAMADTTLYKVVFETEDSIVILNKDTNIVEARANNMSLANILWFIATWFMIGFIVALLIFKE